MNNKIYINYECWEALNNWSKYNPGLCIAASPYFEKFEIIDKEHDVVLYISWKKDGFHVNQKFKKEMFSKFVIQRDVSRENDFKLKCIVPEKTLNNYDRETIDSMISAGASLTVAVNAFMTYGNVAENRTLQAAGRNSGAGKVIVFKMFKEQIYAVPINFHKSPEGVFSVRGHFRRYKSGEVVWIDQYLKGIKKD